MRRATVMGLMLLAAGSLPGQTRIDLSRQAKVVDFSGAASTRPARTGTSLPGICAVGEFFFQTNMPAGQNLFLCTGTNTWTGMTGGVASAFGRTGTVSAQEGDYTLSQMSDVSGKQGNSATVQMFGGGTPANNDCARFDASGNIVSAGAPCGSGGGGGGTTVAGTGIVVTGGGSTTTVAIDSALVPAFLSGQGLLGFGTVSGQSCGENTLTLSGAAENDAVAGGWPLALPAGLTGTMYVSAANVVRVRLCNATTLPVSVPTLNFRATIVRSF